MKRIVLIFLGIVMAGASFAFAQANYVNELEKWRADHAAELLTDSGWLTVSGLFWLKPGINTVGSGTGFDVQLTDNFKNGKFGEINLVNFAASLTVATGVEASNAGKKITSINLASDDDSKPTVIQTGSQSFYLIKRDGRLAVRLKDRNSQQRQSFHGLKWYPVAKSFRVNAKFEPFDEPKEVLIPNVLGTNFKMKSSGILRFKLNGKEYTLQPVEEGEKLFIIFRDLTSKTETYGAGRFLYADKAVNGKVALDFNKAENPPCAFTAFATCPLPPKQNRLEIEIKAGEKRYHD